VYGYIGSRIDQARLKLLPNFLGVHLAAVDDAVASALLLKDATGVYVASVDPKSIADLAGIRSGDVILEYCGQQIKSVSQLQDLSSVRVRNC
jgi:serine protease Do